MKRSEICLIIAECLIAPHFPEDPEAEANYILSKLERFGVRPPFNREVFLAQELEYGPKLANGFAWEPE